MATPQQPGDVLPRPRIPNALGILNIIVATFLMLFSLYLGWYAVVMPMTNRALTAMRKSAQADLEAKRQADLKAIDEAEKAATTPNVKAELAAQRKALAVQPKVELPIGMDLEKLGIVHRKFAICSWVDVTTALVLDALMMAAGIGLLRRRTWGLRLGMATAAAKIVRLVLLYSYVALAIVPPIAQGSGRVAFEMTMKQQGMGQGAAPALNQAFFTKMYYVMYTVLAVAMMLFGSLYPAISLWFLSRPARTACEPAARQDQALSETRALGITNVVFASCLILFGLCFGMYIAALPVLGRTLVQIQKKAEANSAAQQKTALEAIAEDEKKATTAAEKEALAEQRKAIESRPKPPNTLAAVDLGQMGFNEPRIRVYYWIELTSGLLLNVAMITAGIGLLRRKRWGVTLGIGTAAAKILRLAVVYSYFAVAVAPVMAEKSAVMMGKMMVQQQSALGVSAPAEIDTGALRQAYSATYAPIAVAFMVLGSIYPAISLWILRRAPAGTDGDKKAPPSPELAGGWS